MSRAADAPLTEESLEAEHVLLAERLHAAPHGADAVEFWRHLGIARAEDIADLDAAELRAMRAAVDVGG